MRISKLVSIIRYFPNYFLRFSENLNYYLSKKKMYGIMDVELIKHSYPIDFSCWVRIGHYELQNKAGIPIKKHIKGEVYSWSRIINFSLYNYNQFLVTGKQSYKDNFNKLLSFVEDNCIHVEHNGIEIVVLEHDFDWLVLKSGWVGGLVQGLLASLFVRAFLDRKDYKFLKLAEMSCNSFFVNSEIHGGTLYSGEMLWIEEYPNKKIHSASHVLNGFMIGLIGLYEVSEYSDKNKYKFHYYKLIKSLEKNVCNFLVENGAWSIYSNPKYNNNYVTPAYQSLHISLFYFHSKAANSKILHAVFEDFEYSFNSKKLRLKCLFKKVSHWLKNPNTV